MFKEKLESNQYISKYLYLDTCKNNKELIPIDFDLELYNDRILDIEYNKYFEYFKNMYKGIDNIVLDKEQIKAILADEDYSLVLAGAGSGKTTTMVSKVKYLVDIKKIDPSKILVLSFTKKTVKELEKRLIDDFKINAIIATFHSLGMMYIREKIKTDGKCYVVDDSIREQIFIEYFKNKVFNDKDKLREIISIFNKRTVDINEDFIFGNHIKENFDKYNTFEEYFDVYKKYRIECIKNECIKRKISLLDYIKEVEEKKINGENIYTLKHELVRSKQEALIANFLMMHNISYKYEKIYTELTEDYRSIKPDFTLYLNDREVYLEYFGMIGDDGYDRFMNLKLERYKRNNDRFIAIYHYDDTLNVLKEKLLDMGFLLEPIDEEKVLYEMLDYNKLAQFYPYKNLMYDVIDKIKLSGQRNCCRDIVNRYLDNLDLRVDDINILYRLQSIYVMEFYDYYEGVLNNHLENGVDFGDMVYYANKYVDEIDSNKLNFKYVIIDEYQDISAERLLLTKKILGYNHAKVMAVGDDFQSIYGFTGSRIDFVYNFLSYYPDSKVFKITNTYRNSQELIDCAGRFIMKNDDQIKKDLVSSRSVKSPIVFEEFESGMEIDKLKEVIKKIHGENSEHDILVLARRNRDIDRCFEDEEFKDDVGSKITYMGYEDIEIDGMTIHKSKGLTASEVILIGLDKSFPHYNYSGYWMSNLFKLKARDESIPYAEERRIFYVALTRTKNHVYILHNKDNRLCSPFVEELRGIVREYGNG